MKAVAMDWRDEGLLLSVRPHGETAAIIEVFTPAYGRHSGVVRGGVSRRMAPVLQPGTQLDLTWQARIEDHIGTFLAEPVRSRSALLDNRRALAGLNAVTALLHFSLPERDPHPALYHLTQTLLDRLAQTDDWAGDYVMWERALLEELGFGLDLESCAVTGATTDLAYVSPKSGRAVSRGAAGDWADRLLPLPPCLLGLPPADPAGVSAGLTTTGHFLEHHLAHDLGQRGLPEARRRLAELLAR